MTTDTTIRIIIITAPQGSAKTPVPVNLEGLAGKTVVRTSCHELTNHLGPQALKDKLTHHEPIDVVVVDEIAHQGALNIAMKQLCEVLMCHFMALGRTHAIDIVLMGNAPLTYTLHPNVSYISTQPGHGHIGACMNEMCPQCGPNINA